MTKNIYELLKDNSAEAGGNEEVRRDLISQMVYGS